MRELRESGTPFQHLPVVRQLAGRQGVALPALGGEAAEVVTKEEYFHGKDIHEMPQVRVQGISMLGVPVQRLQAGRADSANMQALPLF